MSNNSVLPKDLPQLTSKCLNSKNFWSSEIAKIISRLDPKKNTHSHDMLNIRMKKICRNSICKLFSVILNYCLNQNKFSYKLKKANFEPVHKKGKKQSPKN